MMSFLGSVNSQYERFRTFLNLDDRDHLMRLYDDHIGIWESITKKDYDELANLISHHIYDGFNSNTEVIYRHPEYFKALD